MLTSPLTISSGEALVTIRMFVDSKRCATPPERCVVTSMIDLEGVSSYVHRSKRDPGTFARCSSMYLINSWDVKRGRESHSSEESSELVPSTEVVGDDPESSPAERRLVNRRHQHQQQQISVTNAQSGEFPPRSSPSSSTSVSAYRCAVAANSSEGSGGGRVALAVCVEGGEAHHSTVSLRSPTSSRCRASMVSVGAASSVSRVSWDERSVGTAGTADARDFPAVSGIPDSERGDGDGEAGGDDLFEVADDVDLGAVDLCVSILYTGAGGGVLLV